MKDYKNINISEYSYELPDERIAKYPLEERDASKLLVYRGGEVSSDVFRKIDSYIPKGSTLVFNNTKVIHARLLFFKETGARIEIFCLEPIAPADYAEAFQALNSCEWKCIVGNLRKWKKGDLSMPFSYDGEEYHLRANLVENTGEAHRIEFSWDAPKLSFGDVLEITGKIPVPPYLHRDSEELDNTRYQTVYSKHEGSVAAPTAGLHFTERVFANLKANEVEIAELTLHVGAGTFKPVKSEKIGGHEMHTEHINISLQTVEKILRAASGNHSKIIAVGTTSVRTLESFYWIGVKLLEGKAKLDFVSQWECYDLPATYTIADSFGAIRSYMLKNEKQQMFAATQIIIVPGYQMKVTDALVTNFHQPKSTLLLLISAVVGGNWQSIYRYAKDNDFRFLSYGDSSLLFKE